MSPLASPWYLKVNTPAFTSGAGAGMTVVGRAECTVCYSPKTLPMKYAVLPVFLRKIIPSVFK